MLCLALRIFVSLPTAMLFVMLLSLRFGHLLSVFLLNFLLTNLKALVFCFTPCSVQLLQQALTYTGQHEMSKAQFNFFFFSYPQYVFPWSLVLTVLCGFLLKFASKKMALLA